MSDEKKVVDLAVEPTPQVDRTPIATETPVVETPAVEQQPTVEVNPSTVEQVPTPVVAPTNEDVDEYGVPYKNRFMEMKRKNEELTERLPQMIEDKLKTITQPQTPTYTYEQLEVYKQQNQQDPNIVAWVVGEQRKIQQTEQRKLIEEVVGSRERVTREETIKQKSLEYVQKELPMAFKKDANGNPIAWDETHPITQQIFSLMRNPALAQNPEGLMAAADIAYGRYMRSQAPVLQQKAAQAKADIKQAQKASLTEGAGRRVTTSMTPQQTAIENLRKTGSVKDAEAAIGAILRGRGMMEE
jgi:hypothetical protein